MIYTQPTNVTMVTLGTPVPLSSTQQSCSWVLVQALDDNGAEIYIGGVNPSSKSSSPVSKAGKIGIKLVAGASVLFPPAGSNSVNYDLSKIFIDGEAGDAVSVNYLVK